MTDKIKKYKLTSEDEPTDEMLFALMKEIAAAARESSKRADQEKHRRLRSVASEIESWRSSRNV